MSITSRILSRCRSELAAAAAVLGDWASVYRHRAKLPALQARLRKAVEVPV